ncbi:MAG: hypothetical protein ACOYB1_16730 [Limnohabitans sp.]
MSNKSAIVNTVGIVVVAIGSICVAYEVVQNFKGERYKTKTQAVTDLSNVYGQAMGAKALGVAITKAEDTKEYLDWERRRNIVMSIGLVLILVGSAIQIWSSWIDT